MAQHQVGVGPISGSVFLSDGEEVVVHDEFVYVDSLEKVQEVMHLVSLRYAAEGHPRMPDPENPFRYQPPLDGSFDDYVPHEDNTTLVGFVNITPDEANAMAEAEVG